MTIRYSKRFRKQFKKLRQAEQQRFWRQLAVFTANPSSASLYNHALTGQYKGYRSINVGGDLRALYHHQQTDTQAIVFDLIGTHGQLYGK